MVQGLEEDCVTAMGSVNATAVNLMKTIPTKPKKANIVEWLTTLYNPNHITVKLLKSMRCTETFKSLVACDVWRHFISGSLTALLMSEQPNQTHMGASEKRCSPEKCHVQMKRRNKIFRR